MAIEIGARTLKAWLSEPGEIALIDVREHGQYGEGHPFFAIPLPYSRLEIELPRLVPNPGVRLALLDAGDGVAPRAARRAGAMGYNHVRVLGGGAPAWKAAGFTLFAGVNLPSKTFGEIVEHDRNTPRISAQELEARRSRGDNLVIVDGRPFAEYRKMSIPGGICCPNGELAVRIHDIAPDPETTIVVNCAGRTRSIIGAQTLIDLGVPNPVLALENGTQGWFLAGLTLENGATRRSPGTRPKGVEADRARRAREHANGCGVRTVGAKDVSTWLNEPARTTYLLDIRTPEEFAAGSAPGFVHAPGGQLIQATDQWVGVKGARLVLADDDGIRALMVAAWLRQLGHEAVTLEGGIEAASRIEIPSAPSSERRPSLPLVEPREAAKLATADTIVLLDLRGSMTFRKGHIPQALWTIRPRIAEAARAARAKPVVLVADDIAVAELAAIDLAETGATDVRILDGGMAAWERAGLPVIATPATPADADCIDYLFFVHDRHDGNAEAARQYLAWETGLLAQLDAQERGVFRI